MVEKLPQEQKNLITVIMYSILFTNDLCMSTMFETLQEIEKSPFCKHKIKWYIGQIRKLMRDYNQDLTRRTKAIEFIADMNELFYEKVSMDVWKLENAIYNYMSRCHLSNPKLMAKAALCGMLCKTATINVDVNCNDSEVKHLIRNFRTFRLTKIDEMYKSLYKILDNENAKLNNAYCNLNQPIEITNGYNILVQKIQSAKLIFDVIKENDKQN